MPLTIKQLEALKEKGLIRDFSASSSEQKPKKNKYRAKKVELDGFVFDSIKESKRYLELRVKKQAGEIKYLEIHLPFELVIGDKIIAVYESDFCYEQDGKMVVEDCKSPATRRLSTYRLKRKLMKELHGIEIKEV